MMTTTVYNSDGSDFSLLRVLLLLFCFFVLMTVFFKQIRLCNQIEEITYFEDRVEVKDAHIGILFYGRFFPIFSLPDNEFLSIADYKESKIFYKGKQIK